MRISRGILPIMLTLGARYAAAQEPANDVTDLLVRVNGSVHVPPNYSAASVWVVSGDAAVDGTVREQLRVIDGPARVAGAGRGSILAGALFSRASVSRWVSSRVLHPWPAANFGAGPRPGDRLVKPAAHRVARALVLAAGVAAGASDARAQAAPDAPRWFKGNTHTHTLNSDGDSPPDVVVRWYRENGYQFVVITDHEFLTDVGPLNGMIGATGRFLVIAGQEVTQILADSSHPERRRQAHVNAINSTRVVPIQGGRSVGESYARNLAAIRAAGGLPQVNHPNWRWSVRLTDMLALPDSTLFELRNGHPGINNQGGADGTGHASPSTEALWDSLLTRGKLLFGVGADDSHYFARPWDRAAPRPGQAWVFVRATELTADAIVRAMRRGDFYASTGVTLEDYRVEGTRISLAVARTRGAGDDTRFRTEFIGRGGRVLSTVDGLSAHYEIRGNEGYVRARVTDSNGDRAWTQPVVIRASR